VSDSSSWVFKIILLNVLVENVSMLLEIKCIKSLIDIKLDAFVSNAGVNGEPGESKFDVSDEDAFELE
jgi:hypothetical protein